MLRFTLLVLALVGPATGATVQDHIAALSGPNALAEWKAFLALKEAGDAAVPALKELAIAEGPLQPRLMAIDLLAEVGTEPARQALLSLLRTERKNLAVRGQLCIHLGHLRERRAVPVLAAWLDAIGARSLHDAPGPKEAQPSTCYLRHVEALWMMGDERGIAVLERFEKKLPRGVGYGGFLSNFVLGGVKHALAELRASADFWRGAAGLVAALAPLFTWLRTDPVAVFRHHESLVIHGGPPAQRLLHALSRHKDPAIAAGAQALLTKGGVR
jgi:hypothetical protein